MSTTKFHTHTKQQAKLYFYISWSVLLLFLRYTQYLSIWKWTEIEQSSSSYQWLRAVLSAAIRRSNVPVWTIVTLHTADHSKPSNKYTYCYLWHSKHCSFLIQSEHKVFPSLRTFITRNLLYVEYKYTYFFSNVTQEVFYITLVHFNICSFCCTENG